MGNRIATAFADDDWSRGLADIKALQDRMWKDAYMADNYMNAMGELIKQMGRIAEPLSPPRVFIFDVETPQTDLAITVDKRVYQVTFSNETETSLEIRIERK